MMFVDFRASMDDRSPFGDFWFSPAGAMSFSGARITPETSLQLTAVFACVAVLAESFAILSPVLYRQNGRKKERVTDHWLYRLLAKKPNRYQNAYQWREMLQSHLALRGNAYNRIYTDSAGRIVELLPIHPDKIRQEIRSDGDFRYFVKDNAGNETGLSRFDVWHIKGLAPDIYRGYNPIEIAREAIGIGLSAQAFGSRFFANDARPGQWIEIPGQFRDQEARKSFQAQWQEGQSGKNRGKTAILDGGKKLHELTVNNADAQYLEVRNFTVEEIARMFRVPPHRIGHLQRSTYNNIEHQSLEFVTYTMTPWAERWEASIECDLLPDDDDLEIEFDFSNLLRGDSKSRASYYHSLVLDGIMTRNEAREREGLDPIDGLDEPLRPLNMIPESEAEEEEEEEENMEPENDGEEMPPGANSSPVARR